MNNKEVPAKGTRHSAPVIKNALADLSIEHVLLVLLHRKWLCILTFLVISVGTAVYSYWLPNLYTSETLILVDPQQVPTTYVRPTISGTVRNRLGTLSQQILSATRLQTVIDTFHLYAEERKSMTHEDLINDMRKNIEVRVVSDFGAADDLQAFRIAYTGRDPRVVAQVTNELASLFIQENLKAREQMSHGTSEFLQHQVEETRKQLELQEGRLRDFKLKHIGEMPEQQSATLQILGQLQTQLQMEGEALNRAEQQRSYILTLANQSAPVVDMDSQRPATKPANSSLIEAKAKLRELLSRYGEKNPDVLALKKQIEQEEAQAASQVEEPETQPVEIKPPPRAYVNPVLQTQMAGLDAEIKKHKSELERLRGLAATYQAKLESIPVQEQAVKELERDYEMSKAHYGQLLHDKLSAETAVNMEVRQKGEKFKVLDPARVSEKPSSPNRLLINAIGSLGGLALGLLFALSGEFLGMSITSSLDLSIPGVPLLGTVPIIHTRYERRQRKKRWIMAGATGGLLMLLAGGVYLFLYYRGQFS